MAKRRPKERGNHPTCNNRENFDLVDWTDNGVRTIDVEADANHMKMTKEYLVIKSDSKCSYLARGFCTKCGFYHDGQGAGIYKRHNIMPYRITNNSVGKIINHFNLNLSKIIGLEIRYNDMLGEDKFTVRLSNRVLDYWIDKSGET